jgi:hypothetical protein
MRMKRSDRIYSQGGVYYAFFTEDERPNFEQSAGKNHRKVGYCLTLRVLSLKNKKLKI